LALVHANTPLSLRGTAAWALAADVATLSDVALLDRRRQVEAWLGTILAALLGEVVRVPAVAARPVQVVDATSLGWPGPCKGVAWRVHARLDLPAARFSGFVLPDGHGTERLDRFAPEPGTAAWGRQRLERLLAEPPRRRQVQLTRTHELLS
jgi:hypothetical protein